MKFGRLFRLRIPNPPFGPGRIISSGHIGTLSGIGLFLLVVFSPITELSFGQRIVFGTALWMATWWILGAVPLYVTAFLPLLIFPLTGISSFADTTVIYADRLVFLLLGGFILARAIETTGLHQRFALTILKILPSQNPTIVIGTFMLVTASISAWLCNTATTLMILPIAVAVITQVNNPEDKDRFGACLMLAVAYAASLGGIATLVGTPPNVLCASIAHRMFGLDITFSHWVMIGVPITAISLLVSWWFLTKVAFRIPDRPILEQQDAISLKFAALGKMPRDQWLVLGVFAVTAFAWMSHIAWKSYLPMVDDAMIAIFAAISLFLLPASKPGTRILNEKQGLMLPWGVLLVIGGGLALAEGLRITGLDNTIANQLVFLNDMPLFVVIFMLAATTLLVTQVVINTATAAILLPIAASLSLTLDVEPALLLIPVAVATSLGFILPIGTPPNTVVLGSGYVTTKQMARAGAPLSLLLLVVITVLLYILVPAVFS